MSSIWINGSQSITPSVPLTLSLQYAPSNATLPVSYTWLPRPEGVPDGSQARYVWAYPGQYEVAATGSNCGGPVGDTITVTVMCTAPITRVTISGPTSVIARNPVTLTAAMLPLAANLPITYTWSPTPVLGQGSAQAVYNWIDVGSHPVSLTATNCGGAIMDGHTILVVDSDPPTWTLEVPTDWVNSQSPQIWLHAYDPVSRVNTTTAQYALSTNGGSTWAKLVLRLTRRRPITCDGRHRQHDCRLWTRLGRDPPQPDQVPHERPGRQSRD